MGLTRITSDGITNGAIALVDMGAASVGTSQLAAGAVTNDKVSSSAAIAGTKISPDFGSQGIETTGNILAKGASSLLQVGDTGNDNFVQLTQVTNSSSVRGFTNQHSNASVLENLQGTTNQHLVLGDVNNDDGNTLFGISLTQSGSTSTRLSLTGTGNLHVHNNITLGGTVDGVDIAARNALYLALTSSSGVLNNGVTATTQSAGDNSTKVATTAYTDTAISNLVDSSPSALNTLNELAAALGDDASFSTTVTNSIATKLPLAGGTLTGKVIIDHNSSTMLELKPQNSSPWVIGINRDDLDQSRVFAHNPSGGVGVGWVFEHNPYFYNGGSYNKILSTADEGSGNGLDADTLDGVQGSSFLRSDAADTASGDITFSGGAAAVTIAAGSDIRFTNGDWTGNTCKIQHHSNRLYIVGGSSGIRFREGGSDRALFDGDGHFIPGLDSTYNLGNTSLRWGNVYAATLYGDGSNITGVNATTLDSVDSTSFLRSDADDSASGKISFSGGDSAIGISANSDIRFASGNWTGESMKIQGHSNRLYLQGGTDGIHLRGSDGGDIAKFANTTTTFYDPVTASGDVTFNGGAGAVTIGGNSDIRLTSGSWTGDHAGKIQHHGNILYIQGGSAGFYFRNSSGSNILQIDASGNISSDNSGIQFNKNIVGNAGTGAVTINANSDIRLANGNWTGDASYKIQAHNNSIYIQAPRIIFRDDGGENRWNINTSGHFEPETNNTYDLGTTSKRVRNIYTNDLNLSNEGSANDVDGTWGSYTIQEGEESLFLINKRNGKKYKFNLTEVS